MTDSIQKLIDENKWRDIKDAPVGERGLVFDGDCDYAVGFKCHSWWDVSGVEASDSADYMYLSFEPTHFRTLPDDRLSEVCQVLLDALWKLDAPYNDAKVVEAARQAINQATKIAEGEK